MYEAESENDENKILWSFVTQIDHLIQVRMFDQVFINNSTKLVISWILPFQQIIEWK